MRTVPDGQGGFRHVPCPHTPAAPRRRRKRVVPDPIRTSGEAAAEQLRGFVERFERLEAERQELAEANREVAAEARGVGLDMKGIRAILALRRLEPHARSEADAILDTYKIALGLA